MKTKFFSLKNFEDKNTINLIPMFFEHYEEITLRIQLIQFRIKFLLKHELESELVGD